MIHRVKAEIFRALDHNIVTVAADYFFVCDHHHIQHTSFFAFSCKARCCCCSCDTKRAIIFGMHLTDEVVEKVPHRQWVLTLPKRFRIFVRFDRSLLGKLCSLAYETVREFLVVELGDETAVPGMVAICQTWGDLLNFNSHIHAIVSDGLFLPCGTFVPMKNADTAAVVDIWKEKVFSLLLVEKKITPDVVESMRQWKHSGFEVSALTCPHCGSEMKIVAFVDKSNFDVVQNILKQCGLWNNPPPPRAPPTTGSSACGEAFTELTYDDSF